MLIKTSDINSIKPFLKQLHIPSDNSHKGQNGKALIIGGSSLFHAASIWAAETASHFVDIVHYASTKENEEVFLALKKKFINGIIVKQKYLLDYVKEDDAILIGPGMVRGEINSEFRIQNSEFSDILKIKDESTYTYYLTKYLIENFPDKKFVFDAGALQMMDPMWLMKLKQKPILTPHQIEFEDMFRTKIKELPFEKKVQIAQGIAQKYHCVILLKAVRDIVTDGEQIFTIEGGNAGLTKGGTGDVLAGLATGFCAKNDPIFSVILASYLLKKTSDELFKIKGYWYNIDDIIGKIPEVFNNTMLIL